LYLSSNWNCNEGDDGGVGNTILATGNLTYGLQSGAWSSQDCFVFDRVLLVAKVKVSFILASGVEAGGVEAFASKEFDLEVAVRD